MDTRLHCLMNTYDYEDSLFMIDPNLRELRDLKELYVQVKDLKRLGRGYRNFEHFRTRFLYATRDTPVINGINDYNPVTYFDMED